MHTSFGFEETCEEDQGAKSYDRPRAFVISDSACNDKKHSQSPAQRLAEPGCQPVAFISFAVACIHSAKLGGRVSNFGDKNHKARGLKERPLPHGH
jgi:uncharacterized protein YegL